MQDARDDAIVGIRSTARLFGANARLGVGLFYAAAAVLALAAILLVGGGWIALIGWLAYAAHLAWQLSQGRGRGRRDGAAALPLEPRRGLSAVRRDRAAGVAGIGEPRGDVPPVGERSQAPGECQALRPSPTSPRSSPTR